MNANKSANVYFHGTGNNEMQGGKTSPGKQFDVSAAFALTRSHAPRGNAYRQIFTLPRKAWEREIKDRIFVGRPSEPAPAKAGADAVEQVILVKYPD